VEDVLKIRNLVRGIGFAGLAALAACHIASTSVDAVTAARAGRGSTGGGGSGWPGAGQRRWQRRAHRRRRRHAGRRIHLHPDLHDFPPDPIITTGVTPDAPGMFRRARSTTAGATGPCLLDPQSGRCSPTTGCAALQVPGRDRPDAVRAAHPQ